MQQYNKLFTAILGLLVTIFSPKIPGLATILDPTTIQAISAVLTSVAVYYVPIVVNGQNAIDVAKKATGAKS